MLKSSKQLRVDEYQPGDEGDILALNLAEYGPSNVMVTPEAFHWRYAENPAGKTEITVVRDEEAGRVVGFTWTIPLRMRLWGHDYVSALTANQLIHPDYRDSLAYVRMSRHRWQWLRQQGIPFRFNFPIETLYERTGAAEKMSSLLIPLMVRPLNLPKLTERLFQKLWISLPLSWGGKIVAPVYFHSQTVKKPTYPLKVEQLEQFDERFDELWERVKDKYAIMTIRNRAFLSWRFTAVAKQRYRIIAASIQDKLVGYIVLRCTDEIRNIPTGLIMDLMLEPGLHGESAGLLLMEEAWRYFQAEKVWLAGGLACPHTVEYQVMRRAGYRSLPAKWSPRSFRLAFHCLSSTLPETTQIKASDWFITIADYEAH